MESQRLIKIFLFVSKIEEEIKINVNSVSLVEMKNSLYCKNIWFVQIEDKFFNEIKFKFIFKDSESEIFSRKLEFYELFEVYILFICLFILIASFNFSYIV